jgi:murein DD-endopeptidase MepM/ murein hydrolase activator NlpD
MEQYKMPLLMVACLSLIGGLAWWFMRTELPSAEGTVPEESASNRSPAKPRTISPPKAESRDLKGLDLKALLTMALQAGREGESNRGPVLTEIHRRQGGAAALEELLPQEKDLLRPFTAELLKTWTRSDRAAALTWWRGLKPGPVKEALAKPLSEGCVASSGKDGFDFYFTMAPAERMALNKGLALAVRDAGGAAGLDALFTFQDSNRTKEALEARQHLLRHAADAVRFKDGPEAAAVWLAQYAAEPFSYGAAFDTLISAWAQKDATAAARWALELPTNTHLWGEPMGLPRAVREWAKRDMAGASQWANSKSGHRNYDILAENLATVLAAEDATSAAAWADSIRDPERRRSAREKLGLAVK